jgi:hypothetical protein
MPGDVELYAEMTGLASIVRATMGAMGSAAADLRGELAHDMDIEPAQMTRLLDALESVHAGGRRIDGEIKLATSVVFSDVQPVRDLVAAGKLVDRGAVGPHGRRLTTTGGTSFTWFEAVKLLCSGDGPMLEAIAAVVEGRTAGLPAAAPAPAAGEPFHARAFVVPALLQEVAQGHVAFPAPLTAAYSLWEGGVRGSIRASVDTKSLGTSLPLPSPRALSIARRLPAETLGYAAFSMAIPDGPDGPRHSAKLFVPLVEILGGEVSRAVAEIDRALSQGAGMSIADLLGDLGGEGVVGVAVRPSVASERDLQAGYAVVILADVADPRPIERAVTLMRAKLAAEGDRVKVKVEGGGFSAEIKRAPLAFGRVRLSGGRLLVAAGARDLVEHATTAAEKGGAAALGDDAAHARALTALPASSALRLWIDLGRGVALATAAAPPAGGAPLEIWRGASRSLKGLTSGLSFTATPESDRLRLEVDEVNGIGVFAALGAYGVRRYLFSAKTAEAKNVLGAMTRAAVAAYEREMPGPGPTGFTHSLCKSTHPVPSAVPRGVKYQSSSHDWETGDDTTGWRCLKFMMSEPQRFRYTYTAGGPYKGPSRGGPDPGPNGFEVAAEGDLDGNGVTSLVTRTGVVRQGSIVISTELFVDKEFE